MHHDDHVLGGGGGGGRCGADNPRPEPREKNTSWNDFPAPFLGGFVSSSSSTMRQHSDSSRKENIFLFLAFFSVPSISYSDVCHNEVEENFLLDSCFIPFPHISNI